MAASGDLRVEVLRTHAEVGELAPEWAALHEAVAPGTVYEHPDWALTWARRFVRPGRLLVVAVRRADGGELVGVGAFHRSERLSRLGGPRWLQPLGTGMHVALTEVSQVLVLPAVGRAAVREVVIAVEAELDTCDWVQLSLGPRQGWFEPQWLGAAGELTLLHQRTRPCVVLTDLPKDPDELRRRLKRNVRESVRRSRNRLARDGAVVVTRVVSGPEAVAAELPELFRLHAARASLVGKVEHRDTLEDPADRGFVEEAVGRLAAHDGARLHVCERDGRLLAALLVLSDGATDYLALSGSEPDAWDFGAPTLLVWEAVVHAAESGRSRVNLSMGPDTAKLRWSEEVEQWQDFLVVAGRRRSVLLHALGQHVALVRSTLAERRRYRTREAVTSGPTTATREPGAAAAPAP